MRRVLAWTVIAVLFVIGINLIIGGGAARAVNLALFAPFLLAGALLVWVFSLVALYDLKRIHDRTGEPWESVDFLWALGFFAMHIVGPLLWLVVGRDTRIRELEARARARATKEDLRPRT